jgi:hypothetical protein
MEPTKTKFINDYDFKVHNFSSEQSLQLLAPGTKKLVIPLHPLTEVQSNGHQRYQKHDLKMTVLSRMKKKQKEKYLNLLPTSQPRNVLHMNTVIGDI